MKQIGKPKKTRDEIRKMAAKQLNARVAAIRFYLACGREENSEYSLKMFVYGNINDRYEIRFKDGKYTLFDRY